MGDPGRLGVAVALAALAVSTAACGGTSQLLGTSTTSNKQATAAYIGQLNAAQARLANAEKRIPARPRTPAALSRSIALLAVAIHRLAGDLAAIHPPTAIATEHGRLVSIVRNYAVRLTRTARTAASPGGELPATRGLVSATSATSQAFTSTVAKINTTLQRET